MSRTKDRKSKKLYSFIKSKRCGSIGVSPLNDGIAYCTTTRRSRLLSLTRVSHRWTCQVRPKWYVKHIPPSTTSRASKNSSGISTCTGLPAIPTRFMKEFLSELTLALTLIFQASLNQECAPRDWNQAHVTPLFKKRDCSTPAYYWPTSLTSVHCKIMEHVLNSQITKHPKHHNIFSNAQHGFRKKGHVKYNSCWRVNTLKKIEAVLLGFSKAFDKVLHRRLAVKLDHYGIRGNILL